MSAVFEQIRKRFSGRSGRIVVATGLIVAGMDALQRVLLEALSEHERLVELHAESRARIFALETILEAQGIVAPLEPILLDTSSRPAARPASEPEQESQCVDDPS